MKYLFLAEKPSTMKAIKAAYESSNKPLGDVDFFALAGHICKLCEPKEYEKWNVKWHDRELPMIPEQFKVGMLTQNKVVELKALLKKVKYDAIIVGTDSDVEGNGIYDLIETYLGLHDYKTYRFFESDLTPKGIMRSMNALQDYHTNPRDVGMTQAFRIRSRFDWLIGFNMTVAYTVKSGFLMKVGRVKAPTLKLVYDNCMAIDKFSSTTTYQPSIVIDNSNITAYMVDEENKAISFTTKQEAEKVFNLLSGIAKVEYFGTNIKKTQPNQLFKLTDIQYEAGIKYGYTPDKTLELIQSLYEHHKLISYPRTDGRYVSSEKSKDFSRLLQAVSKMPELTDIAQSVTPEIISSVQSNSRYVNDIEVQKTSHDALIPTGDTAALNNLSADEKNICEMIFRRFLSIFLPPLEEEKSKIILNDNGYRFSCVGSKVINPGFTILYQPPKNALLPVTQPGQEFKESKYLLHEITSKPPARFSQASLIKAMENVQKYVKEADLKNAIKKAGGIGQPSSRAAIISELVSTGYIEDITSGKGKGLHITELGRKYIENLGNSSIVSPELSAQWEIYMNDIREGTATYDEVYDKIIRYVYDALNELNHMHIEKMNKDKNQVGVCPLCGQPVVELRQMYGCSGYPECHFAICKTIAGKPLTNKNISDLLNGKTTDVISGFKSKNGNTFSAALMIKDGGVTWAPFETPTSLKCPKCGANLIKTPLTYKCSNNANCNFILWSRICDKTLTCQQVEKLISGQSTGVIKGFKNRDGKTFDASLIMQDGQLKWNSNTGNDTGLKCPKCGQPILEKERVYACSGNKEQKCDFFVYKSYCSKNITRNDLNLLINKKTTGLKRNMVGKQGKTFDAYLLLDENFQVKFDIQKKAKK